MIKKTKIAIVAGSGPSGTSCIMALLERGWKVVCLDGGISIEKDKEERGIKLIKKNILSEEDLVFIKQGMKPSKNGVDIKKVIGSDYPYRIPSKILWNSDFSDGLLPSFAPGGFSNVWGSAALPYSKEDISDWPLKFDDFKRYYKPILDFTGIYGEKDSLKEFPIYSDNLLNVNSSTQAKILLERISRFKERLFENGWDFGKSRLMLNLNKTNQKHFYFGFNMYGYPLNSVYNSFEAIKIFNKNKNFSYFSGYLVDSFKEIGNKVHVSGINSKTGKTFLMKADCLFIGCGVIPSTGIVLKSLKIYDTPIKILDSQYFLIPCLMMPSCPDINNEKLHSLSQIFLEFKDKEMNKWAHFQLYTFNPMFREILQNKFNLFGFKSDYFIRKLEKRLLFLQGFLHSDFSSSLKITLLKEGEKDTLKIVPEFNEKTKGFVLGVLKELLKNSFYFGIIPLFPMRTITNPGRGFHSGGTIPMSLVPNKKVLYSDIYGRPNGLKRTFVVDSSVFPSIPATTITLSVMANAYRIGILAENLA